MKFEWRKHEKALYGAKSIPVLVDISKYNNSGAVYLSRYC